MATSQWQIPGVVAGFVRESCKVPKFCRHCERAAGLLPPLARSKRYDPDEETLAMSDDELLEALMEGEEE